MTRYYLYIQAGLELDSSTRFYKVGISESLALSKVRTWLEAYANEHGHLFVIWSHDAATFFSRCSESIGPNAQPLVMIQGSKLVRLLKGGLPDPDSWFVTQERHKLLLRVDPHYFTYYQLSKK